MMSFSLAPLAVQMPAIGAAKGATNSNHHPKFPPLNHRTLQSKDLVGICLRKPKSYSTRSTRRLCCKSQLADFAPVTSAAYGILLFSGGLFACTTLYSALSISLFAFLSFPAIDFEICFQLLNLGVRDHSLEASPELLFWHLYV